MFNGSAAGVVTVAVTVAAAAGSAVDTPKQFELCGQSKRNVDISMQQGGPDSKAIGQVASAGGRAYWSVISDDYDRRTTKLMIIMMINVNFGLLLID